MPPSPEFDGRARVSGRFGDSEQLRSAIASLLDAWSLPAALLDPVLIATWEAIANAIEHGGTASPLVEFHRADHGVLTVTVTDQGSGFDPASSPDPMAPSRRFEPGGRGLFMMRRCMDEVHHHSPTQGGTIAVLRKFLP